MKAQDFVTLWQGSDTLRDVAAATGRTRAACSQKAVALRQRGLALKRFRSREPLERVKVPTPDDARALLAARDQRGDARPSPCAPVLPDVPLIEVQACLDSGGGVVDDDDW